MAGHDSISSELDALGNPYTDEEFLHEAPRRSLEQLAADREVVNDLLSGYTGGRLESFIKSKIGVEGEKFYYWGEVEGYAKKHHLDKKLIFDLFSSAREHELSLIDENHAAYELLEEVTHAFNQKRPDAALNVPRLASAKRDSLATYDMLMDAVYITPKFLELPIDQQKAVLAHELGHKDDIEKGRDKRVVLDVSAYQHAIEQRFGDVCEEAEQKAVNKSDYLALHQSYTEQFTGSDLNAALLGLNAARLNVFDHEDKGGELGDLSEICLEGIFENTKGKYEHMAKKASTALNHKAEFSADEAAKDVEAAKPLIEALHNMTIHSSNPDAGEDSRSHPSVERRANNLGCSYDPDGDVVVTCPNTPLIAPNPDNGQAR